MANIYIRKNMHRISEIPALKKMRRLDEVADFVKLADFVYTLIPHDVDNGLNIEHSVNQIYWQFVNKKKFGWCYMHAVYYHLLVQEFGHESYFYDYGLPQPQLTHCVVIVTLRDDKFLIDPYFNRHYVTERGNPLSYADLLKLIKSDPSKIHSKYGSGLKEVKTNQGFKPASPQDFELGVLNSWKSNLNYDEIMMKTFNKNNPLLLLNSKVQKGVVHKKADGVRYFDFY